MRILLISYYFPPYSTVGAVRTGKTAKYLARFGHDVRVVTSARHLDLEPTLAVEVPEERVLRVPWPSADGLAARLLARRRAGLVSGERLAESTANSLISRLGSVYRTLLHFPDEAALGLGHAYAAAARLVRRWQPDVIFASASPASSLILAAIVSRRFGVPWVGELRDLWTDNHRYPYPRARRRLEAALERRVLRSAAGLVTVSEPLAEGLRLAHGRPTAVVLNGFDPSDYPANGRPEGALPLRVAYTGRVAEKQDLAPLVEAVHRLGQTARDVRVTFYGKFLGPSLRAVMERASELGVSESFVAQPPVSHKEALRIQCEADVLLFLTWNDPENRGVYTGKLFEYVGARRPILAVGHIPTVADELIQDRGLGVYLGDSAAIADQLARWIDAKRAGGIPPIAAGRADGLTREDQTAALARFLAGVARPATRPADADRVAPRGPGMLRETAAVRARTE
jgi:glycosyltransferase involved in cell wall biosynthesis